MTNGNPPAWSADDFEVTGRWLRIATPRNKYDPLSDPASAVAFLRHGSSRADLFSFDQKLPDVEPHHAYAMEWDNVAAIPITTFEAWWTGQVDKKVRKHVRRAEKGGVAIRAAEFDDALVRGIQAIYNESPLRGGRPFRHYGDDLETCRRKHATHLDRSEFIGAYLGEELIGFIKIVYAGVTARTIQNIAMLKHGTLAPGNALLAKAVERCAARGVRFLIYGKMEYDNRGAKGFEEYKRANGFEMIRVPRYYVPLTLKGRLALAARLHHGWAAWIPSSWFQKLRALREAYYQRRYRAASGTGGTGSAADADG